MPKGDYGKASRSSLSTSPAIEERRYPKKVGCHSLIEVPTPRSLTLRLPVRQKLHIINDHITDDKEDFDLNLFPTVFGRSTSSEAGSTETSKSNLSLNRAPTKNSIVDTIWSRKQSNANVDIGSGMTRVSTLRSERSDSVVGGAQEERKRCTSCCDGVERRS